MTATKGTLLFDLDDTLIADTTDARAAVEATCRAYPLDGVDSDKVADTVIRTARELWTSDAFGGALAHELGISALEALYADFGTCHERPRILRETQDDYKRRVWTDARTQHGHAPSHDDVTLLIDEFRSTRPRHVTVYDEVPAALEHLAKTHRLGIITNGPADLQRMKLSVSGLEPHFDVIIISGELGLGKPSAAPFVAAMTALGSTLSSTTMVGDNVHRDMAGADVVGMRSIWVTRPELDFSAVVTEHEPISDLLPLLDR